MSFIPTSNGKLPSGGVGGLLKRMATMSSIQRPRQDQLQTSSAVWVWKAIYFLLEWSILHCGRLGSWGETAREPLSKGADHTRDTTVALLSSCVVDLFNCEWILYQHRHTTCNWQLKKIIRKLKVMSQCCIINVI